MIYIVRVKLYIYCKEKVSNIVLPVLDVYFSLSI